eukprot:1070547-Rhodomonas_salina.3
MVCDTAKHRLASQSRAFVMWNAAVTLVGIPHNLNESDPPSRTRAELEERTAAASQVAHDDDHATEDHESALTRTLQAQNLALSLADDEPSNLSTVITADSDELDDVQAAPGTSQAQAQGVLLGHTGVGFAFESQHHDHWHHRPAIGSSSTNPFEDLVTAADVCVQTQSEIHQDSESASRTGVELEERRAEIARLEEELEASRAREEVEAKARLAAEQEAAMEGGRRHDVEKEMETLMESRHDVETELNASLTEAAALIRALKIELEAEGKKRGEMEEQMAGLETQVRQAKEALQTAALELQQTKTALETTESELAETSSALKELERLEELRATVKSDLHASDGCGTPRHSESESNSLGSVDATTQADPIAPSETLSHRDPNPTNSEVALDGLDLDRSRAIESNDAETQTVASSETEAVAVGTGTIS